LPADSAASWTGSPGAAAGRRAAATGVDERTDRLSGYRVCGARCRATPPSSHTGTGMDVLIAVLLGRPAGHGHYSVPHVLCPGRVDL